MATLLGKLADRHDCMYKVMCVIVGLMFAMHGAQKLLGWFGNGPMLDNPMMVAAGVIELLGGLAIALGFFARLAALGGALTMVAAYFIAHRGWNPLATGGELAVMYFAVFLVVMAHGNHKCSLEKKLLGKEMF